MRGGARAWAFAAVLAGAAAAGCGGESTEPAAAPADPVVTPARNGAFAAAVPGLAGAPALSGARVSFAVEDEERERLFGVGSASADGKWRQLYRPPDARPGSATLLAASPDRVVLLRDQPDQVQECEIGGECSPSAGELIGGPPAGPLRRLFGATEKLESTGSCRRRIAQLGDAGGGQEISLSGNRIAYSRRVRCLSPRRRGQWQVVVRDLRTGKVRVVSRGVPAVDVQLAGRYLSLTPYSGRDRDVTQVLDLRRHRVAYRAGRVDWSSLGSDGTLAVVRFHGESVVGRLGWHAPRSPRLHRLPNKVLMFSASPLSYARGRIAYVTRGDALAVTDLRGRSRIHARRRQSETLDSFAFDGRRLAFVHTRWRADRGGADAELRSECVGDRFRVQASASVIEVHPVTRPGRIPATRLPSAAPYRSPVTRRPRCPYPD